jgi:transcriptional regulator with XRE-family HTH domain
MTAAEAIREARRRSALTQAELAARSGTSQATVSAYEAGRKQPSAATLARILAAAGQRLALRPAESPVVQVSEHELAERGRRLVRVLELADLLPSRHAAELRYPPLRAAAARGR